MSTSCTEMILEQVYNLHAFRFLVKTECSWKFSTTDLSMEFFYTTAQLCALHSPSK